MVFILMTTFIHIQQQDRLFKMIKNIRDTIMVLKTEEIGDDTMSICLSNNYLIAYML